MELISRSEAVRHDLKKYYTGEPCRNGHVAARYTQSGACCQCIREYNSGSPGDPGSVNIPAATAAMIAAQRENERQRTDALRLLAEIKVWAYPEDAMDVKLTAAACCIGMYPCLTQDDVLSKFGVTATEGGMGLYRVKVPPEHIEFVRQVSEVYASKRSTFDADAARTQALGLTPAQIRFAMSNGRRQYSDDDLVKNREMINSVLLSLGKEPVR